MNAVPAFATSCEDLDRDAFVRGVEQHAVVLAQYQCGSASRARAAVLLAKAQFHQRATDAADTWPALYWRCVMAQPALRTRVGRDKRNPVSLLDAGPRAALLLRFVARLEPEQGASALEVSPEAYRHALFRATQTLADNGIDESWMRALRDRLQAEARPPHDDPQDIVVVAPSTRTPPAWLRPTLMGALALLVGLGIVSFFWVPSFLRPKPLALGQFETLAEQKPAEVMPAITNLLAGGDFALLADPQGAALARDLDLYSWYAASADTPAAPASGSNTLPETTMPETAGPDVDADSSGADHAP
ncbi:MAG: hypothetical protein JSS44_11120 [Proteobacteria bacterium]|nr:hypothetical protein [Pseudomonadota bacterium]MBS0464523.1 hypothetical protein [Pseudomonadota bacterium]